MPALRRTFVQVQTLRRQTDKPEDSLQRRHGSGDRVRILRDRTFQAAEAHSLSEKWTWSRNESVMEARVKNWGIAVRGGLPGAPIPDEETRDPDELDAEIIEVAMCKIRHARHMQYAVMKYLYVRGRSDQEAANYFRRPEKWVQDRNREGMRWLINHLGRGSKGVAMSRSMG